MDGPGEPLRVDRYDPSAPAEASGDGVHSVVEDEPAAFFYDLGNPDCYLVAERVMATMPVITPWIPVLERAVIPGGVSPDRDDQAVAALAARAAELELLPLRWPAVFPQDTEYAMLAATYARQIGRAVVFSLAAFRQVFAAGRNLADRDTVLIAAAACEMHPTAIVKSVTLRSVAGALEDANQLAREAGITRLPAIQVGDRLFQGPDAPERAAAAAGEAM